MAQQPPHPGAAHAAGVNPNDVAPSNMNSRQKQAVADVVAHDAAKGANVYVSGFDVIVARASCGRIHAPTLFRASGMAPRELVGELELARAL